MASAQTQRIDLVLELDDRMSAALGKSQQAVGRLQDMWTTTQKAIQSFSKETFNVEIKGEDKLSPKLSGLQSKLDQLSRIKLNPNIQLGGQWQKLLKKGLNEAAELVSGEGQQKLLDAFDQLTANSQSMLQGGFDKLAREAGKRAKDAMASVGASAAAGAAIQTNGGSASGAGRKSSGRSSGTGSAGAGASGVDANGQGGFGGKISRAMAFGQGALNRADQTRQEMTSPEAMLDTTIDVFQSNKGHRIKAMTKKAASWAGMSYGKDFGSDIGRKLSAYIPGLDEETGTAWGEKIGEAGGMVAGELLTDKGADAISWIGNLFSGGNDDEGGAGRPEKSKKQGKQKSPKNSKSKSSAPSKSGGKAGKAANALSGVSNAAKKMTSGLPSKAGGIFSSLGKGVQALGGKIGGKLTMPLEMLDDANTLMNASNEESGGDDVEGGAERPEKSRKQGKQKSPKNSKSKSGAPSKSGGKAGKTANALSGVSNAAKKMTSGLSSKAGGIFSSLGKGVKALGGKIGGKLTMPLEMLDDANTLMNASKEELPQKAGATAGKWAGTWAGAETGAMLGAAIGSVVPGLGTAIGGAAGGLIGGIAGSSAGEWIGDKIGGIFGSGKANEALGGAWDSITSGAKGLFSFGGNGRTKDGSGKASKPDKARDKASGKASKTKSNGKTSSSGKNGQTGEKVRHAASAGGTGVWTNALSKLSSAFQWAKDHYDPELAREVGGDLLSIAQADTVEQAAEFGGTAGSKYGSRYGAQYGSQLGAKLGGKVSFLGEKRGAAIGGWIGDTLGNLGGNKLGGYIGESIGKLNIPQWKEQATSWLNELPGLVQSKLSDMLGSTMQELAQLPSLFADWWGQAKEGALAILSLLPDQAAEFIARIPDRLLKFVKQQLSGYLEIGQLIADALFSGVSQIAEKLGPAGKWVLEKLSSLGGQKEGTGSGIPQHARGGILTTPHLGLVAENGPEAIIPLSAGLRERAIGLWQEAGSYLGIQPYGGVSAAGAASSGGSLNIHVGGVAVQLGDHMDDGEMAQRIGREIVQNIRAALENRV
ncbi:hypothetical protein [Paenibacillus thalictri]|uniref:Uncharacterized protein n=1 Tax=Paenibacillus thalictri TaxID=2527873 RepID=A0A4Q9DKJ9_9BACL|nr:hypothetical protein [Paenibacillus thalictri]TBL71361.1 hypothetical protein EYB31_30170 [Paenibacillus thalictri]